MSSINELANNFKKAAERCDEQRILSNSATIEWLPIPFLVNASLACELYLKSILEAKKITPKKVHELNDLFFLLPKEIQDDVTNRCVNMDFDTNLVKASNIFVEWRYLHEKVAVNADISADLNFMRNLMNSLNFVAETINKNASV